MVALSRLMLDNFDHIKAYWIMLGIGTAQTALAYGADDIDGTVRHELIYHDAGATTPEVLSVDAEGHFAVEDTTGVTRLLIKAPGHRQYEIPISTIAALEVDLPPFEARAVYIPFMLLALPERIDELIDVLTRYAR